MVHFGTSCAPAVQAAFDRAVALLHSFAYEAADAGFADAAARDPHCAMAHWGRAMTHYHQLWEVPAGAGLAAGIAESDRAAAMSGGTPRERALVAALGIYYAQADKAPPAARAMLYSDAMAIVVHDYPADDEIATFYALSLIATSPRRSRPRPAENAPPIYWSRSGSVSRIHPGVPHYLIHAYDSAELAQRRPARRAGLCEDRAVGPACAAHAVAYLHPGSACGRFDRVEHRGTCGGACRGRCRRGTARDGLSDLCLPAARARCRCGADRGGAAGA